MELINYTPFPAMVFESRDLADQPWHVLVVRATLTLAPPRPRLGQRQHGLILGDQHYGAATESSVRDESDLAPFKPSTDVLVRGTARAPGGVAATAWEVSATVGERTSRVRVTGPRWWTRASDGRWVLSDPLACSAVPLRYELAYGGGVREGEREEHCENNPLGTGFAPPWWRDGRDRIAASQIEWPDDPLVDIDRPIAPAGLGPVGRAWPSRVALAGTFDERWRTTRWPVMPEDFDDAYWCCAPRGLGAQGYLRGDEEVRVTNVGASGEIAFSLPGHTVFALLRHESGVLMPFAMQLDTVSLDTDALEVGLVWRLKLALDPPLRALEVRMEFRNPEESRHHGR